MNKLHYYDLVLACKIMHDMLNCDKLCTLLQPRAVPYSLLKLRVVQEDSYRSNYWQFSPIARLRRGWTSFSLDFQDSPSITAFKSKIRAPGPPT